MKAQTLTRKYLPQNPDIEVLVPNYKEPILPVNHGGFGWYGLQAYNEQGQLMCHECGVFRDSLGQHIREHGLKPREYKEKYGLLNKARLVSDITFMKHKAVFLHHPELIEQAKARLKKINANVNEKRGGWEGRKRLEFKNRYDTCPAQLIRWLTDLAEIFGPEISQTQVRAIRPGLDVILAREFSSFNKAKQIAKLTLNYFHHNRAIYTKQIILEDMCRFYHKYNRWPKKTDYNNQRMLCSFGTITHNGGLLALRQEAMKLRQEQEAARIRGDQIVQYANNIEMEFAGRSMR